DQTVVPGGSASDPEAESGFMARMLDGVERLGNKVPHPVLMFLYLIGFVIILSQILAWFDVSVTELIAEPVPVEVVPDYYEDTSQPQYEGQEYAEPEFQLVERTISIESLLTIDG